MMSATMPRTALVISHSELENIQRNCESVTAKATRTDDDVRFERAMERVQTWGNTIEALREKKIRDRQKRLDEEEARRKELDAQEAEFRAEQRRKAIERANKLLYMQNDRVKNFNSACLLSNVLKERDMQVAFKNLTAGIEQEADREWSKWAAEEARKAAKQEEEALLAAKEKAKALGKEHEIHMHTIVNGMRAARVRSKEEGRLIAEQAEKAREEERLAMSRRREELKEFRSGARATDAENRRIRNQIVDVEKEEEEYRKNYLEAKEIQKAKIEEVRLRQRIEKDLNRQKILKMQTRKMRKMQKDEEEFIERMVEQADKEQAARELAKQKQREEDWQKIVNSRTRQLERKERLQTEQDLAEREMAAEWQKRIEQSKREEQEEKETLRQRSIDVQHYLLKQVHDKSERLDTIKQKDDQDHKEMKSLLKREEDMFKKFTDEVMSDYSRRGLTIKPMEIALKKQRASQSR